MKLIILMAMVAALCRCGSCGAEVGREQENWKVLVSRPLNIGGIAVSIPLELEMYRTSGGELQPGVDWSGYMLHVGGRTASVYEVVREDPLLPVDYKGGEWFFDPYKQTLFPFSSEEQHVQDLKEEKKPEPTIYIPLSRDQDLAGLRTWGLPVYNGNTLQRTGDNEKVFHTLHKEKGMEGAMRWVYKTPNGKERDYKVTFTFFPGELGKDNAIFDLAAHSKGALFPARIKCVSSKITIGEAKTGGASYNHKLKLELLEVPDDLLAVAVHFMFTAVGVP